MKSELYFPLRTRRDGSLDTDRNCLWTIFWHETLAFILIAAFFVGITLFVLNDPFNIGAPDPRENRTAHQSSVTAF